MGIPSGFAAYAAGDPGRPGRGELRKPPTIVFCQYWKFNAIRDSLNLVRAYPGVRLSAGTLFLTPSPPAEKSTANQDTPTTDLQKNFALNSVFCDLNIRAAA